MAEEGGSCSATWRGDGGPRPRRWLSTAATAAATSTQQSCRAWWAVCSLQWSAAPAPAPAPASRTTGLRCSAVMSRPGPVVMVARTHLLECSRQPSGWPSASSHEERAQQSTAEVVAAEMTDSTVTQCSAGSARAGPSSHCDELGVDVPMMAVRPPLPASLSSLPHVQLVSDQRSPAPRPLLLTRPFILPIPCPLTAARVCALCAALRCVALRVRSRASEGAAALCALQ